MTLSNLLTHIDVECDDDRTVEGVSDDSRLIQRNWLFVARDGYELHGDKYVKEVLDKGGIVLSHIRYNEEDCYLCSDIEGSILSLLREYYGDLNEDKIVIGVTGTNGKSSVTDVLKQMLIQDGKKVMTIGTNWVTMEGHKFPIDNTTPSIFLLAYYFNQARNHNINHIIMEVSSHAIDQHRIDLIAYDIIIYTNITHDHLDYHVTLTHYQYTKFKLRKYLKRDGVIIMNNDDTILETIYSLSDCKCISVGTKEAHMPIRDIDLQDHQSIFSIHGYLFQTKLLSLVNVYNISEAICTLRFLGISYPCIQTYVKKLEPVEGRLKCIQTHKFTIWIDYAHTFTAVKTLVQFAISVKKHHLIMVIGCGGEREQKKRYEIGKYCAEMCDVNIFTADNPRREPLMNILHDMLSFPHDNIKIIENRLYAIKHAVKIAEKDDIIIIAGKGNEKTQIIKDKKYSFHDESCVYEILEREDIPWY